ncbi:hypothetical protein PPYR_10826 [Photinus pyralis]|uniref:Alcohol dehydrogenase n=1 Tax=Photinus pyralis TaxID=7054 RepID=A0A1Y1LV16_PHOPY|nr:15-hydroxyprostaglandin dehydrogenase [NAD(+)]-like [Photinus pyralis]XP_031347426.1 15-hydroxyprostaglandin dehydrogenase [NAD(+)]-like [Photinus pyralis]KAB0796765.1 hypothetical protein PPYR_10826 [Photinus pyralis]
MFEITGKIALVTGGVSGIGLAISQELLRNGLKAIVLVDVNEVLGQKVLGEMKEEFGSDKVLFLKADVREKESLEEAFNFAVQSFQHLDIVINAAGILTERKIENTIATNLNGTIYGTLLAFEGYLPKYKKGTEGVILNIASTTGLEPFDCAPIYSCTKWGVVGFTRCLGTERQYKRNNIKVLALCPGFTNTPSLPVVKDKDDFINFNYQTFFESTTKSVILQPASHVAKAAMWAISQGESGSMWVVTDNEPVYEAKFEDRKLFPV